jgi:hypothetical protein
VDYVRGVEGSGFTSHQMHPFDQEDKNNFSGFTTV